MIKKPGLRTQILCNSFVSSVILLYLLFASSCPDPFFPGSFNADGTGTVYIEIGGSTARVLMPSSVGTANLYYVLEFIKTGNSALNFTETLDKGTTTLKVDIASGEWTLNVRGYATDTERDTDDPDFALVEAEETFTVTASSTNLPVKLTANESAWADKGKGKLSYSVTLSAGQSGNFLVLNSDGSLNKNIELTSGNNEGEIELMSGVYNLSINATENNVKSAFWKETACIYHDAVTSTGNIALRFFDNSLDIASFSFQGIESFTFFDPNNEINVWVQPGTDVTKLTPEIDFTGFMVDPPPGTAKDFSSPIDYTVYAANGSCKTYTVTVIEYGVIVGGNGSKTPYETLDDALCGITTAGDYTVTLYKDQNITPYTQGTSGINITFTGSGAMRTIGASGSGTMITADASATTGTITLGNNITADGEIWVYQNAGIKLQGNAIAKEITLTASTAANSSIEIPSDGWSGSVSKINLLGLQVAIHGNSSVTYYWTDKAVLKGSGLTTTIANNLNNALNKFYTNDKTQDSNITPYYYINNNGVDIGKLKSNELTLILSVEADRTVFTPLSGETVSQLTFEVEGIVGNDTYTISLKTNPASNVITFDSNEETLTYDGNIYITGGATLEFEVSAPGYTAGSYNLYIEIFDGITEGRSIPVNQDNIKAFNDYLDSSLGRNKFYKQTENITIESGYEWKQTITNVFTGTYNGSNYWISGIVITEGKDDAGMFRKVGTSGTVKNLGLINVNITGKDNAGGISSENIGIISNCYVQGTVTGNSCIGGIAGNNNSATGKIKNCYVQGTVTGNSCIGGIAGYNNNVGTIEYCYSDADVKGSSEVGGIAGQNASGSKISNCVALNKLIIRSDGSSLNLGRVYGSATGLYNVTENNYARSDMLVAGSVVPGEDTGFTEKHGKSITEWAPDWFCSDSTASPPGPGFTDTWWTGRLPTGSADSWNLGLTFNIPPFTDDSPEIDPFTIHRIIGNINPNTITLDAGTGYNSYSWIFNGVEIGSVQTLTLDATDSAKPYYNYNDSYVLTLKVVKDGKQYSCDIEFAVKP